MDSLASTTATVSCKVTGITTALAGIKWYDSGNTDLSTVTDGSYTLDDGGLVGNEQNITLTVTNGVTVDTTYQCEIDSIKYEASINVYSKLIQPIFL